MPEPFEQPDAIAVDRAEESLLKGALDPRRTAASRIATRAFCCICCAARTE